MARLTKPKEAREALEAINRSSKIVKKIRERYSVDEELAIQRKYMNAISIPKIERTWYYNKCIDDFNEYYAYVEQCKDIVDECLPF